MCAKFVKDMRTARILDGIPVGIESEIHDLMDFEIKRQMKKENYAQPRDYQQVTALDTVNKNMLKDITMQHHFSRLHQDR